LKKRKRPVEAVLKIAIVVVGALKRAHIREAIEEYIKRLKRYTTVELVKVKAGAGSDSLTREELLRKEAERLERVLKKEDLLVVLDEKGKALTTAEFSRWLEDTINLSGRKRVCFVVGGSYGLSETIKKRAHRVMSLSKLTLPYELATLVLAEQLYRAFTIIKGEPYSH